MRIVDEWTTDEIRCTVMMMNGRYSLKMEKNLLEQTFKFRDGQIDSVEQLKSLLTPNFYSECNKGFIRMGLGRASILPDQEEESFPQIV